MYPALILFAAFQRPKPPKPSRKRRRRSCGKRRFRDLREAREAAHQITDVAMRAYHCDRCNGVHLTSQR